MDYITGALILRTILSLYNARLCFSAETEWLQDLLPEGYDKTVPDVLATGSTDSNATVKIYVSIFPFGITDISEKKMEFEVELTTAVMWTDSRLRYKTYENDSQAEFVMPTSVANSIWRPPVLFVNCRVCKPFFAMIPGENVHILLDKRWLQLKHRNIWRFACHYDLRFYPMDQHRCYLFISMNTEPGVKGDVFSLFKFDVLGEDLGLLLRQQIPPEFQYKTAYVDHKCHYIYESKPARQCLCFTFEFRRIPTQHVMLLYVPSSLIVLVSFVSFWLDVDATAPRVALGLTSMLTLTTQFSSAQKNLPSVAYIKAIDVWMLWCVVLVFASFIEFAIANYTQKKKKNRVTSIPEKPNGKVAQVTTTSGEDAKPTVTKMASTNAIDFYSRIVFPVIFSIFTLWYWCHYGLTDYNASNSY